MKVTDKNFTNPSEVLGKTKGADKKVPTGKSDSGAGISRSAEELASAKVKLSDKASDLKKIKDRIDATPDIDEAKVAKYKNMIAKGEYKVDAKAVADKMVDESIKNDFFTAQFKDE